MLLHRRNFGEVDLVCERLGTSLISPGIRAGWAHFGLRGQAANLGTGLSSGSLREHLSRKAEDESGGAPSDSFHLSGCESLRPSHESWMSYAVLGMTDTEVPNRMFVEGPDRLLQRIVSLLKQGQGAGEFDAELNADDEAAILLGLMHGLSTAVMIGLQSGEAALRLLILHLDRLKRLKA